MPALSIAAPEVAIAAGAGAIGGGIWEGIDAGLLEGPARVFHDGKDEESFYNIKTDADGRMLAMEEKYIGPVIRGWAKDVENGTWNLDASNCQYWAVELFRRATEYKENIEKLQENLEYFIKIQN